MNVPEHRFMKQLEKDTKALCPDLVWFRHSDSLMLGVPDVEVGYKARTTWLEIKWLELPKKHSTLVDVRKMLRPGQLNFLQERRRVGIPGWIIIGSDLGPIVLRPSEAQEPRTVKELAGRVWHYRHEGKMDFRYLLIYDDWPPNHLT